MVMTGKVDYNLDKEYWRKLSNPNDSIPVLFYWNSGESVASLKDIETIILPMATRYSTLFASIHSKKLVWLRSHREQALFGAAWKTRHSLAWSRRAGMRIWCRMSLHIIGSGI